MKKLLTILFVLMSVSGWAVGSSTSDIGETTISNTIRAYKPGSGAGGSAVSVELQSGPASANISFFDVDENFNILNRSQVSSDDGLYASLRFYTNNDATTPKMTLTRVGNVGIGTASVTAKLQVVGLAEYADNAAAVSGGLTVGAFYHTAGVLKVVIP